MKICFKLNKVDLTFCNFLVLTRPRAEEQVFVVCLTAVFVYFT